MGDEGDIFNNQTKEGLVQVFIVNTTRGRLWWKRQIQGQFYRAGDVWFQVTHEYLGPSRLLDFPVADDWTIRYLDRKLAKAYDTGRGFLDIALK